ncbi:MAG TPA: toll/interleukin-1 receptor domain-containing protein, partial [Allosphingosinicella sp.]|nr:toll/interleukin-1 receptor domain-containing protein [Allosphingosinicella sp.]
RFSSSSALPECDCFISHASEDKEGFVRALAAALQQRGVTFFYDEISIAWGDSLRRRIDEGLARSKFGVVVLSEAFFRKEWPQRELDGLVQMEMLGRSKILPIWHKVSKDEVAAFSPMLADKAALNTSDFTADEIAEKLAQISR